MLNILLLEDDKLFASTLEDFLQDEGYCIHIANDSDECLTLNYKNKYDLYIFDINVPKLNGLDLLSQLRNCEDNTPTIFLTSYKDKETLHTAFKKGCDDYLTKPVDLEELSLRIQAVLKRNNKLFENIKLGETFIFNAFSRRLYENGKDINLTAKVIDLLELFIENRKQIVTKDMIINRLWDMNQYYSDGAIRVYINNLKKILGKNSINNIKGIGYRFEL